MAILKSLLFHDGSLIYLRQLYISRHGIRFFFIWGGEGLIETGFPRTKPGWLHLGILD
jgi:hypothetical protein